MIREEIENSGRKAKNMNVGFRHTKAWEYNFA
jgi:hypothetical protein